MNAVQKRVFRIEQPRSARLNGSGKKKGNGIAGGEDSQLRHHEIMAVLNDLRQRVEPQEQLSEEIIEAYKHDIHEARRLKDEMNRIYEAITRTKQEIVTLHKPGCETVDMGRMTDELSAIVSGTEQATDSILHAAEEIDSKATELVAALRQQANQDHAQDIQEKVVQIFEACNFQDLTGQRITKVVNAFRFIEARIEKMMEIWGGIDSFKDIQPVDVPVRTEHEELLNGPALEEDEDVASQDDVDALFD